MNPADDPSLDAVDELGTRDLGRFVVDEPVKGETWTVSNQVEN
jgi:hypothetical protein